MKHLPNILTLANLFCGTIACILIIVNAPVDFIFILLVCSLIFDFFDGFAARAVKASGPFGRELDSLADIVTFGVLPGLLMFNMLGGSHTYEHLHNLSFGATAEDLSFLPFLGLVIPLFSALRLAKFNLDEEQCHYFKGLPTPANTIFIFSLYFIQKNYDFPLLTNLWFLSLITLLFSYLLIANIPLLALKFKSFKWKDNSLIYSFLLICFALLLVLKIIAIPLIIFIYIILSIIFRKKIISNGATTA